METAFVSWVSIFSPLDNGGKLRHSFICQLLIKGPLTAETSSLSSYEHNALEKAKLLHPSYLWPRQHSTICQQRWADSRALCCLCGLRVGLESGSESTLKISFAFCFIKALWLWEGSRKLTSLQEMCCDFKHFHTQPTIRNRNDRNRCCLFSHRMQILCSKKVQKQPILLFRSRSLSSNISWFELLSCDNLLLFFLL